MSTSTLDAIGPGGDAARVLAGVRSARSVREAAEREQVCRVLEWAVVHQVDPASGADVTGLCEFGERCLALAGPGAPRVAEFASFELAAALGMSSESGARYLGNALEVRYRLPRLWARLAAGELTVWRAFRIAEQTRALCADAAAAVDARLSAYAHQVSGAQIDRTVTDALAVHDPDTAAALADAAKDARCFEVALRGARPADRQGIRGASGVVEVTGLLDVRDALDLEHAVARVAEQLADLGSTDSLDVRRSVAVGEIARAQQTLDLHTGDGSDSSPSKARGGVTVYAHLRPGTPLAELDSPGVAGVRTWVGQVRDWCQTAGVTVTIQPVVDLGADLATEAYTPTAAIRRVVELRDRHCVFPWCSRPAWRCDLDHVTPFDRGGPTSTANLAPLCRRHHRAKTHSGWTYDVDDRAGRGHYRWTSPGGLTFTVDPTGTLAGDRPPDPLDAFVPISRSDPPDG